VTNGGAASVHVYDGGSLKLLHELKVAEDPDNLRFDPAGDRVYVGHGSGKTGAIGVIDPVKPSLVQNIPLDGHPESFQLESRGPRIFVNVPSARHVAVIDRVKGKVVATWRVDGRDNFPMALDEEHRRLFIACRTPAKVLVFDTTSGKTVASFATVGDADDLFYDAEARRIYVIGGGGSVMIVHQDDPDRYSPRASAATAPGARTGLFVPAHHALYVAAPRHLTQPHRLLVFDADTRK
jgi:DNA-binding beta-propeller fold protein YncE